MAEEITNNRLIAKNATMLYIRMFFTMAISFYTSRIVLQALGVSDYGIYNVVGGTIVIIDVLVAELGGATSRFLTFSLGKKDVENLKRTFSTTAWLHIGLAVIFVIVAETFGLWFVNTQLVIPEGRMIAANWVYQAAVVNFAMGLTQTPYNASITSHEHMSVFAYISIVNAICKLGIAVFVLYYSGDHLILYSVLLMSLAILFRLYYRYYCVKHFEECHITRCFDVVLFKKMLVFSGWNMMGSVMLTLKNQGVNILINRFFGTLLNAASGVALQVQGLLYAFTSNITTAFNPQIIKSYAAADYGRVNELIGIGTKFTSFVTTLTTIPFIFSADFLMSLWLKEVPEGAVAIVQVLLLSNFCNSFNFFIYKAIMATGKIKTKNIVMSCFYVFLIIGTFFILKFTHSYIWAYVFGLVSSPMATIICAFLLKKVMPMFSAKKFFQKTYLPMFCVFLSSFILAAVFSRIIESRLLSFVTIFAVCESFTFLLVYFFVLDKTLRHSLLLFIRSKISRRQSNL